jgi:hypothetical protein
MEGLVIDARYVLCSLALALAMCGAPPEPAASPSAAPATSPAPPAAGHPGAPASESAPAPAQLRPDMSTSDEPAKGDEWSPEPETPSREAQRVNARREFERAEASLQASASDCATACRALASMTRAVEHLCALADSPGDQQRCDDARRRMASARERVRQTCGACSP